MASLRTLSLEQRSARSVHQAVRSSTHSFATAASSSSSAPSSSSSSLSSSSSPSQLPQSRAQQLLSTVKRLGPSGRRFPSPTTTAERQVRASAAASSSSLVRTRAPGSNGALEILVSLLSERQSGTLHAYDEGEIKRADRIWEAYLLVKDHAEISSVVWNRILRGVVPKAAVAANRAARGLKAAERSKKNLTAYHRAGYEGRMNRILEDKMSVGQFPHLDDYMFMLDHFAQAGSVKSAEQVFQNMVSKDFEPGPNAYVHRLQAIKVWLRRYDSLESRLLIKRGRIPARADAIQSVPQLVSAIMTEVQERDFIPLIPERMVDEASAIFAHIGDWEAFNLLARWGYGVDLDVPDAIPQEYIERIEDGSIISRGLRQDGLHALLHLLLAAGQPWRALSSLDIFAYDTASPDHLHPSLSRSKQDQPEESEEPYYLRFAPPLPPTTAVSMMNLSATPVVLPQDLADSSLESIVAPEPSTTSSSSIAETAPSSFSTQAESLTAQSPTGVLYEPLDPAVRFPSPAVQLNHTTFTILLRGVGALPPSLAHVELYQHVLKRALAAYYEDRQRLTGSLLEMLSYAADDRASRARAMHTLDKRQMRVRPFWFRSLRDLLENESHRKRFEVLGWAEEEMRNLRLTEEMDKWVRQKAIEVLVADRKAAISRRLRPDGHPFTEKAAETLVAATDYPNIDLQAEAREGAFQRANFTATFRAIADARVRAAWLDLRRLHALVEDGHPPSFVLEDDETTLASRVAEYTLLLTERLSWELEPTRSTSSSSPDVALESIADRFAAFGRVFDKGAYRKSQLKQTDKYLRFPTTDAPNLFELETPTFEFAVHPSLEESESSRQTAL